MSFPGKNRKRGVLIGLLGPLGVRDVHHRILISVEDIHRAFILADGPIGNIVLFTGTKVGVFPMMVNPYLWGL